MRRTVIDGSGESTAPAASPGPEGTFVPLTASRAPAAPGGTSPRATFGQAALLGSLGSLLGLGVTLVRTKVSALVLGPSGVGVSAEVLQYATLAAALASVVAGPALASKLAEAHARGDRACERRIYSTALNTLCVLSLVGGILSTLLGGLLLVSSRGEAVWLHGLLAAIGVLGGQIAVLPTFVLTARGALKTQLHIGLYAATLPAVASILLTAMWGLTGQFLALALTPLITLAVTVPLASRALPDFAWLPSWCLDGKYLRAALKVGTVTLLSGLLTHASLMLIRRLLDREGGSALIGQFQAAWSVGGTYLGMILGGLASFAFPRYAAATTKEQLAREIHEAGRFVLRLAPPVSFLAIAFCDLIIQALYSGHFTPATRLLGWQFVGDLPKVLAWVLGGPLLYRGKVHASLAAELFYSAVFTLGAYLFVPRFGLEGVGFAYVVAYGAFLPLVFWLLRRSCGMPTSARPLWWVLGLSVAAAVLLVAVRLMPGLRAIAVLVALLWWWRAGLLHAAAERIRGVLRKLQGVAVLR